MRKSPGTYARWAAAALAALVLQTASAAVSDAGPSLDEALRALRRETGLRIFFSTALVRPEMRVGAEPSGKTPRERLESLLRPHGVTVREGPDGALLVVPGAGPKRQPPAAAGGRAAARRERIPLPQTLDEIVVVSPPAVSSLFEGTTLRENELEKVPNARDPWSVVTRTPGVLSDRINVGGNESGTQASVLAPGSSLEENVFLLDGVNATDMASPGTSALFYDFDQLEELQVRTGGADVRTPTAGVVVSVVTRRGTDQPRGSGRLLVTDADGVLGLFQGGLPDVRADLAPEQGDVTGNQVERILDFGLEAGGPIVRRRLWGWGAVGSNDIDLLAIGLASGEPVAPDETVLDHAAVKLNAQVTAAASAVASWNHSNKRKENLGAGPQRSPETTRRQDAPADLIRLEATHLGSPRFFLTGRLSVLAGGFSLVPHTGLGRDGGEALFDLDGVWRNGSFGGTSDRDATSATFEAAYVARAGGIDHLLEVGVSRRDFRRRDDLGWAGPRQAYGMALELADGDLGGFIVFERRGLPRTHLGYTALWLQDSLEIGRFRLRAGLRLDVQEGRNLADSVRPNPVLPVMLPGFDFAGGDAGFDWRSVAPRLAATYAFDAAGRSRLRLSYGRFASQLAAWHVGRVHPGAAAELTFFYFDLNADRLWQKGEPFLFQSADGVDPRSPTTAAHRNDPGLDPEITDELRLGLERDVGRHWTLGLGLTSRQVSSVLDHRRLVVDDGEVRPATAGDYDFELQLFERLPDGELARADFYFLSLPPTGGALLTNGDRRRRYLGLDLSFQRRFDGRSQVRGFLHVGETDWDVPASFAALDDPVDQTVAGDDDGEIYAARAPGAAKRNVFLQSSWAAQIEGSRELAPERPWSFTLGASLFAREGYPIPYDVQIVSARDEVNRGALLADVGEFRTDDILTVDLSLEKEIAVPRTGLRATLSLVAFNVFDQAFVLQRERNLGSSRGDFLLESLAPRVVRLGLRLRW